MSPGTGFARSSSFTSLRQTHRTPDLPTVLVHNLFNASQWYSLHQTYPTPGLQTQWAHNAFHTSQRKCSGMVTPGAHRSEVKEEGFAQQNPGDIRGGGRPA